MRKNKKEILADSMRITLNYSNEWFANKTHSEAFIIAYLQGTINEAIKQLKDTKYA